MSSGTSDTPTITGRQPWLPLPERFEPIKVLGDGSAGVVYHARDRLRGNREIALKILTDTQAFDDRTVERFREELRVCQQIRHPNIVEAYELLRINGFLAFSMEYVPGADLAQLFKKKRFTAHQIDLIFEQLLGAIDELHVRGILHRDIKLENVLLRRDGTIKLSDLGLMKQYQKELTANGVVLGTAHYLPPEYVREGKYDVRSEVWALGTMLFEMVTGKRWLAGMNGNKALEHLIRTKFAFPLESLVDVRMKYRHILDRCLCYNPTQRFQNIGELKRSFESTSETFGPLKTGEIIAPKVAFSTTELKLRYAHSRNIWRRRLLTAWVALLCIATGATVFLLIKSNWGAILRALHKL